MLMVDKGLRFHTDLVVPPESEGGSDGNESSDDASVAEYEERKRLMPY
jgi:hypothetical protein